MRTLPIARGCAPCHPRSLARLIAALLIASCSSPATGPTQTTVPLASSPPPGTAGTTPADWPTYHRDPARTGAVGGGPFSAVEPAWATGALDGDVYAEPIVVGGVVLVATERNSVYAFDARSGAQLWKTTFGQPVDASVLPCGNIRPVSGITGTPVADPASGLVYVVAFEQQPQLHHELYALEIATGAVRFHDTVDAPGADPRVHQQRPALALANGLVYVAYGGLFGDCGDYKGTVVGVPADGGPGLIAYRVPVGREGGIWAPSGMAIDTSGNVFVATGNSDTTGTFDYNDSVLRLSPRLELRDHWAPADWLTLSRGDIDLGSVGPTLLPGGFVAAAGKNGYLYLMRADRLGGIGGEVAKLQACAGAYGGFAYADGVLYVPCSDGLVAVAVEGQTLRAVWRGPRGDAGSPIVAGGAVWVAYPAAGTLYALATTSGEVRVQRSVGRMQRFTTPTAWGDLVLVAADGRLVALRVR